MHGWGRSSADFHSTLDGLSGQAALDAIALDLPGFGATPPPPSAWGSPEYASAVSPVLDEMADQIVLVGHSFGGRVAAYLAPRHPDRVKAVILSSVPLIRLQSPRRAPALFLLARRAHRMGLLSDDRLQHLRIKYGSSDYRAAQGVMRSVLVKLMTETYDAQLRALDVPVELVWGDDDKDVPLPVAEQVIGTLRHGSLSVCPGAGHLVPLTAPSKLRELIEQHRP